MTHPDLDNNIFRNPNEIPGDGIDNDSNGFTDDTNGWDFVNNDNNPIDDHHHGTHVAGIVSAETNNGEGVAGIAPDARLIPVKVLDSTNHGLIQDVIGAINYAVQLGAKVINMSLGGLISEVSSTIVQTVQDAITAAREAGIVVVAGAGNNNGLDVAKVIPAGLEGVLTVGATDASDRRASFSNIGDGLEVTAPGDGILSTILSQSPWPDTVCFEGSCIYGRKWGTSMATPFVSGLSTLMLAQDPLARYEDIVRRLKFSSVDLGTAGFDRDYGYGRIDAFRALSYDYYDDGRIKTQWLEAPDENGLTRLDFDTAGRFLGGSVSTSGITGLGASLAAAFSSPDTLSTVIGSGLPEVRMSFGSAPFSVGTLRAIATASGTSLSRTFLVTPLLWNALESRYKNLGNVEESESEDSWIEQLPWLRS